MPDDTKSIENERETPATRPRYEPPVLLDLGELSRGQGIGGCHDGSIGNQDCFTGTIPALACSSGVSDA